MIIKNRRINLLKNAISVLEMDLEFLEKSKNAIQSDNKMQLENI